MRVISEPKILAACVGVGMRIEPLMKELLTIMANLMPTTRRVRPRSATGRSCDSPT